MPSPLLHVVAKFVITGLAEAHILAFTALNRDGAGSRQRLHQFGLWKTLPVFAKFDQHGWSQTRSQPRQGCENNVIRVLLVEPVQLLKGFFLALDEHLDQLTQLDSLVLKGLYRLSGGIPRQQREWAEVVVSARN